MHSVHPLHTVATQATTPPQQPRGMVQLQRSPVYSQQEDADWTERTRACRFNNNNKTKKWQ